MHRFKQADSNKHGRIISVDNSVRVPTIDDHIASAQPIWIILNITEEEYYEKFHPEPVTVDVAEVSATEVVEE